MILFFLSFEHPTMQWLQKYVIAFDKTYGIWDQQK